MKYKTIIRNAYMERGTPPIPQRTVEGFQTFETGLKTLLVYGNHSVLRDSFPHLQLTDVSPLGCITYASIFVQGLL